MNLKPLQFAITVYLYFPVIIPTKKGKFAPGQAEKGVLRMELYFHLFMFLAIGGGEIPNLPPGPFTPGDRIAVTF